VEADVVRTELRRSVPLLVLFVLGLAAGVWVFVSPWALGYPTPASGWTTSIWTSVWAGAVLTAASAASLVALLARVLYVAQRSAADASRD
jgi:hypothetical protein